MKILGTQLNRYLYMSTCMLLLSLGIAQNSAIAASCADKQDTYSNYDNRVSHSDIKNIASEYYVLSYTWAPSHCAKVSERNKKPGKKDYLQCDSGKKHGYILHGLWPQGALNKPGKYPRACEGDQKKIDRRVLNKYLCMTPSVWLLQHEYEYHGTCMHNEALETPEKYFDTALALHSALKLPKKQLRNNEESVRWWLKNNPRLPRESIQYYHGGREWQFCYNNDFKFTTCPGQRSSKNSSSTGNTRTSKTKNAPAADDNSVCEVKGNISNKSGKKYYFTSSHSSYQDVVVTTAKGERCFASEQAAKAAGWKKAP